MTTDDDDDDVLILAVCLACHCVIASTPEQEAESVAEALTVENIGADEEVGGLCEDCARKFMAWRASPEGQAALYGR